MTIERARIIKAANAPPAAGRPTVADAARDRATEGHRLAREVIAAHVEAEKIIAGAEARAERAVADAAIEARESEVARLAATFLALREEDARRIERDRDRIIEIAVLLAERLVGEAIRVEPARIAELAASAIHETRGARRVRIDASPDDVKALEEALSAVGQLAEVHADAALQRGSLVVHTDLGKVDARLEPQLARLAVALREVLS